MSEIGDFQHYTARIAVVLLAISAVVLVVARTASGDSLYTISDIVWVDDGDGIQEMDDPYSPEDPLPGVTVNLFQYSGGSTPSGLPLQTTTTNSSGQYSFDVAQGVYILEFVPPATNQTGQYQLTISNNTHDYIDSDADDQTGFTGAITVTSQSVNDMWDAGFVDTQSCGSLEVGDQIWRDLNADGFFTAGVDEPIQGLKVQVWQQIIFGGLNWGFAGQDITDSDGKYEVGCLDNGTYISLVEEVGGYRVQPIHTPDPNTDIENDNNFHSIPIPHKSSLMPAEIMGRTNSVNLFSGNEPSGGGDANLTIDGGFLCDEEAIDIVFVVDSSSSMRGEKIKGATSAISTFIDSMDINNHRAAIVSFNNAIVSAATTDLTNDKSVLSAALANVVARGETDIEEAIQRAESVFVDGGHGTSSTKKPIMILLSDGKNDSNRDAIFLAAQHAREEIPTLRIITVSIGAGNNNIILVGIANDVDDFYSVTDGTELGHVYLDIRSRLCNDPGRKLSCQNGGPVHVSLSTGWDQELEVGKAVGAVDDEWVVDPDGNHAWVVSPFVPLPPSVLKGWPTLSRARWISRRPDKLSDENISEYQYTREFDLPAGVNDVFIKLLAVADDIVAPLLNNQARIVLNGNSIETQPGGTWGAPAALHVFDDDPNKFQSGTNTLSIKVDDSYRGLTGLVVDGYVSACIGDAVPTATLAPTNTSSPPTATPTLTPTPGPTACPTGSTIDGSAVPGGTAGEEYVCVRTKITYCQTEMTRVDYSRVLSGEYAEHPASDAGLCNICASCFGIYYCDRERLDTVAVADNLQESPYNWSNGTNVELLNSEFFPKDLRRWAQTSRVSGSQTEPFAIERSIEWAEKPLGGGGVEPVIVFPVSELNGTTLGSEYAWARSFGSIHVFGRCPNGIPGPLPTMGAGTSIPPSEYRCEGNCTRRGTPTPFP